MVARVIKSVFLLAGVSGLAATSDLTQAHIQWVRQAISPGAGQTVQPVPGAGYNDPLNLTIDAWKRLQQSDNWPFSDYANFLLAHPGWPGETSRQTAAETVLDNGASMPGLVVRFFERFAPRTAAGHLRYAEALAVSGRRAEADDHARRAWRMGVLRPNDEARLTGSFLNALTPADHDTRMDMLLWRGATDAARRQIAFVSPGRRALFDARLAYRTRAQDADARGAAAMDVARNDAGFLADRATWLRDTGQSPASRESLANRPALAAAPGDLEEWYEVLLTAARGAAADGQFSLAYRIASRVDDAVPPGALVADMPLGERDDYTSLTWLAGTVALYNLQRPGDAAGMFERYSRGSKTPQTQSKGLYWAGRAAEAAGDTAAAQGFYARAGGFPDLYYGQLALERMSRPLRAPASISNRIVDAPTRDAFFRRETVRAAQLLGQLGRREDQGLFIRQIARDATTDTDHVLAAELSRTIGRPDLGVMVGRSALENGLSDYTVAGYPSVPVPESQNDYWTIIHAIARQESQFDRNAVSHAGARGLMQLMPGTAAEVANRLGLGYRRDALNADTNYNIQLGSSYFQRMFALYGSYPLAVAAYNAGPGNVNKWIRANGDPRSPGGDMVRWVENIPYFETKNYVQRVLENAVVYDLLNPQRARSLGPANLSWYLGKNRPG
ncbi:lytic transglycosylase domain-containing protein [Sphingomonas sp. IC-56]|uniref:lytic transglycosylase domain-containing protein n=1 Tax=Sphingomonas sp. IC-56 TaxID=2898529 RepID=UPI001E57B95C|nr:lytic transglycosylase domain-containing protein [Sphingomonas sp. IC-56]MCD2325390.1 lytic transglycosylase domain-containing protein [Sphingomonas sp. IC-56]